MVEITENRLLTVGDTTEVIRNCKLRSLYMYYLYASILYIHVALCTHVMRIAFHPCIQSGTFGKGTRMFGWIELGGKIPHA